MNAVELLKGDHEKVTGILEKLESTTERAVKTREDLFSKLKEELDVHTHIEEILFYPAIRHEPKLRPTVLQAYESHHLIKGLLRELSSISVDSEQWTAKLKLLKQNVERHIEEEESEILKKAGDVLTSEEADELGDQMEAEKQREISSTAEEEEFIGTASGTGGMGLRDSSRENPSIMVRASCPEFLSGFFRRLCG